MSQTININASTTVATIDIEGTIGSAEQGNSVTTYKELKERLEQIEQLQTPIVMVNIRSVGGDVSDAILIYEALLSLDAHITTRCYGYTASAATIIAQAANEGCREIADSALYLIHNSSLSTEGNAQQLIEQAELLKKTDERIAAIYAAHSDKDAEYYAQIMSQNGGQGVWLSPEQALEAGLVDTIVTADTAPTKGLIERVAKWLGLTSDKPAQTAPAAQLPVGKHSDTQPTTTTNSSLIALTEGQAAVQPTTTAPIEDPDYQGAALTANAAAYNRDLAAFK
ncbi:MAG: Clp protease ClpP [Alistipes sp.]|nr:Clp protease ClpP [Alistipes sp.]